MILHPSWAPQLLHNWIALLGKKQGGHRCIAIMASMVRLIMRLLCRSCRAWDIEYALPGDTAAAGKQAVTEIAICFAANEVAKALHRRTVQVFWDATAFYDTLDLQKLCKDVIDHAFPGPAAVMALQAHVAPRRLRVGPAYGHEIAAPGRGVLAGCSSSTSLSRLYLAGPLRATLEDGNHGDIGVHVDDVCQSSHDVSDKRVAMSAISKGLAFAREAISKGLIISSKSAVVASSISLARKVAGGLSRGAGLKISAQLRAEDLGVGVRPGLRSTFVLKRRLKLGLERAGRAAVLRQAAGPQAGKLFATGVRPQICYGHSIAGMSLMQRRSVLSSARRVSGPAGMRSCPITTVYLRLGILPVAQLQADQVKLWL